MDYVLDTTTLRIQTLGSFQVWRQEDSLKWPTQKSKALLQILLVEPGREVPTDQILEYLWPTLQPNKAQNNLWVTVSQLRRLLEPNLPPRTNSLYIHKTHSSVFPFHPYYTRFHLFKYQADQSSQKPILDLGI